MPHYMVQASYTAAAVASFIKNPQDRTAGVKKLAESAGGKMEQMFFSMGDYDVVVLLTLPDDVAAASVALSVNAAGHLKAFKTTKLLTPDEFLAAQKKAQGDYKPPV